MTAIVNLERLILPIVAAGFVSGCIEKFEAGSAYDDQVFLCAESMRTEFEAEVAGCREDFENDEGGCTGVLSLEGMLEGQPLTIDTRLISSVFRFSEGSQTGIVSLRGIDAVGPTPYFVLTFKIDSIGGLISGSDQVRRLEIDRGAQGRPTPLDDEAVAVALRLTTGGDSVSLSGLTGSGEVAVTNQDPTQMAGRFEGEFGSEGDFVDGCFHLFAAESVVIEE